MSPLTRLFVQAVIVADVLALVFFGGRLILTGSPFPQPEETPIVVPGAAPDTSPKNPPLPIPQQTPQQTARPHSPGPASPNNAVFNLEAYTADPVKGAQVAARCKACHTFESGGPNRSGPNLFKIFGRKPGSHPNYPYSAAMQAEGEKIGQWDTPHLTAYLASPKDYVPGTKMHFVGVKNAQERADLIAWLKTLK